MHLFQALVPLPTAEDAESKETLLSAFEASASDSGKFQVNVCVADVKAAKRKEHGSFMAEPQGAPGARPRSIARRNKPSTTKTPQPAEETMALSLSLRERAMGCFDENRIHGA